MALQNAGFEIAYECIDNDNECKKIGRDIPLAGFFTNRYSSHHHYSLARLTNSSGDIYAAVFTARRHGNRTLLIVLEEQPMETGKVQVDIDAEAMARDIDEKEMEDTPEDVEGSEDHPMISRYEGSYITDYEQFSYDRQQLVTGMENEDFERTSFEGEVTRIHYTAPEGRSALEVHQNYTLALQDAGFEMVYECIGDDSICQEIIETNAFNRGSDLNYSLARLTGSAGDIYAAVHTARRHDETRSVLLIVEEKSMESGKVQVDIDAEAMARDIDDAGRVMLYGIHFDTGRSKHQTGIRIHACRNCRTDE
ncbi:MAG: hypothetical protein U5K72_17290 [Balneolaceae bacterium]|nr:hypothetical protein [Balneolaceae bacterium]